MVDKPLRIAIVGSASLIGKELTDILSDSALGGASFTLLDEEQVAGQVTSAGDEIAFVQRIDANSFDGMDLVFFAGDAEVTRRHWKGARKASAAVIDLSYALDGVEGIHLAAPWVTAGSGDLALNAKDPELSQRLATAVAHPAAIMLALITARLEATFNVRSVAATVLLPASEFGRAAMDELHQQTIRLLSFQSLPTEQYDTQVAFNVISKAGDQAKINLREIELRIQLHHRLLSAKSSRKIGLQVLQAPVFHGYGVSLFVELAEPSSLADVKASLAGSHIDLTQPEAETPSNVSATGKDDLMVMVRSSEPENEASTRFNLWCASDNLRLAALNAAECGIELQRLRTAEKA
jgi:aspartate-semialdehyde dehydrogenase